MTKIDIISGFLGSGKTTLIKKLVKEAFTDENIVIIENEFGEIGIDGGFLKDSGINITEMNSGCICCSLVGDFGIALQKVLTEYAPDRIVIEPSGVGKLSDVISAVKNLNSSELVLNSFSTVVDAKKCKIYHKNFGEFFNNQISSAKTVILSHTNTATDDKITNSLEIIKELNENALVVTTDWDKITGEQLLDAIEKGNQNISESIDDIHHKHLHHDENCECHEHEHHHEHCDCGCHEHEHHHDEHCDCGCHEHEHHHHHHADEVFTSIGIQLTRKFTYSEIENILNELMNSSKYGTILRAKGIIDSGEEKWIHFDYIPGEPEIRYASADVTGKICVIGSDINKEELEKLFK